MRPVIEQISIPIAAVSFLCTILLLLILRKMRWNGFIILIFALAVCTLIRSFSYFFLLIPDYGLGLFLFIEMISDIQSGLWTNIISMTLLRMVFTLKTVNILKEVPFYIFVNILLPFSVGIYQLASFGLSANSSDLSNRIFYWMRATIIVFNLITYSFSIFFATKLDCRVPNKELTQQQADAIKLLVFRMQAYPLAQVIMRIGPMW
jgi:hypothetical protein